MAMSSISATSSAAQALPQVRQSPPQGTEFSVESEKPKQSARTPEAENVRRERQPEAQATERPETPRPVVNAQGQRTGTIVNTTA